MRVSTSRLLSWKGPVPLVLKAAGPGLVSLAEIGFVAASALIPPAQDSQAAAPAIAGWRVPDTLHEPIRQDLVLLKHGAQNQAAQDFAAWLGTDAAREIIAAAGYALPPVETETQPAPQAAPAHQ